VARLWVDETRPLLQGARLTAYEAGRAGIPHAVLADSAAASLMAAGEVDLVLTGADRIAADGSVANKVGTYGLAVLAHHHRGPFARTTPGCRWWLPRRCPRSTSRPRAAATSRSSTGPMTR